MRRRCCFFDNASGPYGVAGASRRAVAFGQDRPSAMEATVKRDRAREFLFEPARFKNDPAVMQMSLAARGAYAILFCEAWDMPEPGVFPNDDHTLAMLARSDFDEWLEVREQVSGAFDITSRPGFWVQRGTVDTYERQQEYFGTKQDAGRQGGIASGKARKKQPRSTASSTGSTTDEPDRLGVVGVVLTEKEKEKDSSSSAFSTSDSSPATNGHVNPVRTRTGNTPDPGPAFWNDPATQDDLARLKRLKCDDETARSMALHNARLDGRLPA